MSTGLLFLLSLILEACLCHKGLLWPTPRNWGIGSINSQTAPTSRAPCGSISFERAYSEGKITNLQAGSTVNVIVYEHIKHSGEPMRLAISGENNENFEDCIWLNHIPQHTLPNEQRNLTISLKVPDFTCKNCTLQLIAFQTDNQNFETDSTCCAYNSNDTKTCPLTQYYSCANININGGSRSRSDVCVQQEGWANRDLTCNYYRSIQSANAWELTGNGNELRLKTSGDIANLGYNADTFCAETDKGKIRASTGCHKAAVAAEELSLLQGGELQADGAIAIVIVILLVLIIGATVYITKKKGIQNANETSN